MGEVADALRAARRDPMEKLPGCTVARKLATAKDRIEAEDWEILAKAVVDVDYPVNSICRVFNRLGFALGHSSVSDHRNHGDCTAPKSVKA